MRYIGMALTSRKQDLKTELFSLGMDWHGDRARVSTDLYTSKDRVDGVTRGINLGKDIAIPKPPKPETLLNPDWSFVDIQDKGAMIRGEYDLTNNVMGYATYGQSKTEYKYNGAMSATVLDNTEPSKQVLVNWHLMLIKSRQM